MVAVEDGDPTGSDVSVAEVRPLLAFTGALASTGFEGVVGDGSVPAGTDAVVSEGRLRKAAMEALESTGLEMVAGEAGAVEPTGQARAVGLRRA